MRVRIYYREEGIRRLVFEGDKKVLSDLAKCFLGFIEDNMKPNLNEPISKKYEIEVEIYGKTGRR